MNFKQDIKKQTMGNSAPKSTKHRIDFSDSRSLSTIKDQSVDHVVTSPPYPMIEMWDNLFTLQNPLIGNSLQEFDGCRAFELMNQELDKIWDELARVVKESEFVCINIGDATRLSNVIIEYQPIKFVSHSIESSIAN